MERGNWIPEICYEEVEEGLTSHIPFIQVPPGEIMPGMLFVFESHDTGEVEPGPEGEEMPVFEMELHQYANMLTLKNNLDENTYDQVRSALGLESLRLAAEKGKEITSRIRDKIES